MTKKITIANMHFTVIEARTPFINALASGFSQDEIFLTKKLYDASIKITNLLQLEPVHIIAFPDQFIEQPYPDGSIGLELGHSFSKFERNCTHLDKDLLLISGKPNDDIVILGTLAHELYHCHQYARNLTISEDAADAFAVFYLSNYFKNLSSDPGLHFLKNSCASISAERVEKIVKMAEDFHF